MLEKSKTNESVFKCPISIVRLKKENRIEALMYRPTVKKKKNDLKIDVLNRTGI